MTPAGETIPLKARLTGWFWLGTILTGVGAEMLASRVLVRGDPAGTAAAVLAGESFIRLSILGNLLTNACYVGVTVLLYDLMKPVSRSVARLGLICGTLGLSLGLVAVGAQIVQLSILKARWMGAIPAAQLEAMSYAALALKAWIFPVGMSFFGVQMATTGWMIARSTYFPRWVGVLLGIGGSVYVLGAFTMLLTATLGAALFRVMMITALIGEGTFTFWLLIKGIDRERWVRMVSR